LIFVDSSPRFVDQQRAAAIASRLRSRGHAPSLVGVFLNASTATIRETATNVGLDLVQLHGSESDEEIRQIGVPAIKSFRVGESLPDTGGHENAQWFLFDTHDERRGGGTGRRFDWSLLSSYSRSKPFFLSGGLTAENVAAAVVLVRPDAIDVASGVESAPGLKDHDKVDRLFERLRGR
jgi:phosphoribosylanthranilate isomerase